MITVFAPTKYIDQIQSFISSEDRLDELVDLRDALEHRPAPSAHSIVIKGGEIHFPLDWYNKTPPYLLPENIPLNQETLLGVLFAKLGNMDRATDFLKSYHQSLLTDFTNIEQLTDGRTVHPGSLSSHYTPFEEYRLMHNQAIIRHYAPVGPDRNLDEVIYFYGEALQSAPNDEFRAYTAKNFANLFLELAEYDRVERVLQVAQQLDISSGANIEIKQVYCQLWMQLLAQPYDPDLLKKLKSTLSEVLRAYRKQGRTVESALLLTDAGKIANYDESWSESLGYFNEAIQIFDQEEYEELSANAQFHKGVLLFTWAKQGNPQFFKPAAEAFQQSVRIFNQANHPKIFADIQHYLGMIYAEIPADQKKKSIWAAVSSSAFQEALTYYNENAYPYEYAMVCNHYANALLNYPEAKLSDNTEKALYYYQQALSFRKATEYPLERSMTILNYLEAQWRLPMPEDRFDEDRYKEMVSLAQEVIAMNASEAFRQEALEHLVKLSELKAAYSN